MENVSLKVGLNASVETWVSDKSTAEEYGSGDMDVYATPAMIGLMERAALSAVSLHLPKGYTTVGTSVNIKHLAGTPMGMKVKASAELIAVEGRKLTFKVEAFDGVEKIGEGSHERYIVISQNFRDKVYKKSDSI
ncbi:thioesterase family protein [Acetivibrio mesophilus]|uniref:Thioesterase n=1 Tax=Acetivibrio mesophilus TaxID=2487273 RepID=A0A4Q0I3N7_9FIRM|nr:thioesterase family protein [Acetivibrio mesophilus]ODM27314.1 thioesterase [Clostridium sp. Bc-iso-3]RXE58848.1 thioesterase [Acetivibrio mesophilus]HHV29556.1 thioesterase family protein [Clostridium sp.]